jgi:hypothetical protein
MTIDQINQLAKQARRLTSIEQGVDSQDLEMWVPDDVYLAGYEDGKIVAARCILDDMGITWKAEEIG